ncbi:hypothetical protein [Streptomyces sp. NPDC050164]|uniref:hypothetical protein n=1 Tax=Streptomyces sp. NPDC050164 TaxID=3365605 RepID=UPI00378E9A3A
MFCKRMAVIHRKGRARLEALREEHRAESERLLEVFGDVLAAVREAAEPADTANEPDAEKDTGAATIDATGRGTVDTPPKDVIATRLDLAPGALFPTAPV